MQFYDQSSADVLQLVFSLAYSAKYQRDDDNYSEYLSLAHGCISRASHLFSQLSVSAMHAMGSYGIMLPNKPQYGWVTLNATYGPAAGSFREVSIQRCSANNITPTMSLSMPWGLLVHSTAGYMLVAANDAAGLKADRVSQQTLLQPGHCQSPIDGQHMAWYGWMALDSSAVLYC